MKRLFVLVIIATAALLIGTPAGNACTRILYRTGTGNFLVGRTMDWYDDLGSDLWAFPAAASRGR